MQLILPCKKENNLKYLLDKILYKQRECNPDDVDFFKNLGICLSILEFLSFNFFISLRTRKSIKAYSFAKSLVFELWTVRIILAKLKINLSGFDDIFPNIKKFRDALAHFDERIEGKIIKNKNQVAKTVKGARKSVAGGLLQSPDHGKSWYGNPTVAVNISILDDGLISPFAIMDHHFIINDENGAVDIELKEDKFIRLVEWLEKEIQVNDRFFNTHLQSDDFISFPKNIIGPITAENFKLLKSGDKLFHAQYGVVELISLEVRINVSLIKVKFNQGGVIVLLSGSDFFPIDNWLSQKTFMLTTENKFIFYDISRGARFV